MAQRTVTRQPLLVLWEEIGHLDLLVAAGAVSERLDDDVWARFARHRSR